MPPLDTSVMTDEELYAELYKPQTLKLSGDPSQIRLLNIPPGTPSDPLSITLELRTMSNRFYALSYHWGDPQAPRVKVPCNGLRHSDYAQPL